MKPVSIPGEIYVDGSALLLAQLLDQPSPIADDVPLSIVAKHVMPSGLTALLAKPDIPTWLVGTKEELAEFEKQVPAPTASTTLLHGSGPNKMRVKREEVFHGALSRDRRICLGDGVQ